MGQHRTQSPFCLAFHRSIHQWWFMKRPTLSWRKNPHRHSLGQIPLILSPRLHLPSRKLTFSVVLTVYHVWSARPWVGGPGGNIFQVGERLHPFRHGRRPRFVLRDGPLVPPWLVGRLVVAVVGPHLSVGIGFPDISILGAPLARERMAT